MMDNWLVEYFPDWMISRCWLNMMMNLLVILVILAIYQQEEIIIVGWGNDWILSIEMLNWTSTPNIDHDF
jgi:hypothetical protein